MVIPYEIGMSIYYPQFTDKKTDKEKSAIGRDLRGLGNLQAWDINTIRYGVLLKESFKLESLLRTKSPITQREWTQWSHNSKVRRLLRSQNSDPADVARSLVRSEGC